MLLRRISDWPSLSATNSFSELERMRRQMDWLSSGILGSQWREPTAGVFPSINITEDKDNYYVRAELPGLKADELNISVTGNTLSISGERKLPDEDEKAQYHRREREAGKFNRIVSLPTQMDTSKVQAQSNEGILTVILPKAESSKPRQIPIKAS